ncbi:nuclear receptor corepressor 2-like [Leguminivora glycinivorella]|uniref:nuclear receptor corepressor 2-like n=1 Tax=Leguminivora glycinivorella TaxID=1035111 RepID=UPI00200DA44E|nr:nuclear receptor corepressor 2-like [Leguminivora glycinivorella]
MAQYTQRTQPMHRPGQSDHGHGALAFGGKPAAGAVVQPRAPAAPYPPQYPALRLHQPGYGSAALSFSSRDSNYRGGGAVGEYRPGTRMSILGTAYLPPPAPPAHHPPPADPPPFKKIRLTAERHQPLRVDTREPVNSYGAVEVLSPNPPSEPTVEEQSFRTTKDELIQQISKVDREMALSEAMLAKLKKKQEELEQTATKPAAAAEPEEAPPRHRSLAQNIYAENRKKAASAHAVLAHLGPPVLYPLYNQPQDTEVYHENIRKHRGFKKRLVEHVRRLRLEAEKREDALAEEYSKRAVEWARRVERIEQGQKRKAKDARNREFFEKVFPELRKQREERERFNRLGARVKSEAELEEIADGLHEQEHEVKKMRSLTVVPPLLRDPRDPAPVYKDTNRRCMDMEAEHKELEHKNVWTTPERDLFKEKYLQHPKNFVQIASFLPRKSVGDCVRFYYLSKKRENYRQLLRKTRQRRTARGNPPRPAPEPELPAGVVTRLQRSQGTVARPGQGADKEPSPEEALGDASPPAAAPLQPAPTEITRTPPLPPSPPPASSAPPAPVTSTAGGAVPAGSPAPPEPPPPTQPTQTTSTTPASLTTTTTTTSSPSPSPTVTVTPAPTPPPPSVAPTPPAAPPTPTHTPQPAQPPTPQPPATPETAVIERISTPSTPAAAPTPTPTPTPTPAACAVCGAAGATRAVSRSRALFYGLREDAAGSRVCDACHTRCVRCRYTWCPSCHGPKVRAKRLRHLPPKWHDLSPEVKKPLLDEWNIPSDLSKCCLSCFKKITRWLETVGEHPTPDPTEEEASRFRTLLREHGTSWEKMAAGSGKTPASFKAFYFTYRKKLQLDALVAERPPPKGSDTDDSVLSSGDTDTASAEVDSSATETAAAARVCSVLSSVPRTRAFAAARARARAPAPRRQVPPPAVAPRWRPRARVGGARFTTERAGRAAAHR